MASDKGYLQYILDRLSGLEEITYRPMMGEYILYFHGKVIGGIYDNRLLVKPVEAAATRLPKQCRVLPYPGAKPLLLVESVDDGAFLQELFIAMYDELPAPRPRKHSCVRPIGH